MEWQEDRNRNARQPSLLEADLMITRDPSLPIPTNFDLGRNTIVSRRSAARDALLQLHTTISISHALVNTRQRRKEAAFRPLLRDSNAARGVTAVCAV